MSKCANCSNKIPAIEVAKLFAYNAGIKCTNCGVKLKSNALRMAPFNLVLLIVAFTIGFMISEENNSIFWILSLALWVLIMGMFFSRFAILAVKENPNK